MSEEDLKVTRRNFLRHSAMTAAMAGTAHSIALRTDALAAPGASAQSLSAGRGDPDSFPYPYAMR